MRDPASLFAVLRDGERRAVFALLALTIIAGGVAAVSGLNRAAMEIPTEGGTYHEAVVGKIARLNPLTCRESAAEADVCALVFAGLTRQDPESNSTVGDLAEKWRLSTNNRVYTFTLRAGARFHDGTPVTTDDVLFTYKTLLQDPAYEGLFKPVFKGVAISQVDARTITFALQKENAFFPEALAIGILPQARLKGITAATLDANPFTQSPVGAGPFRLISLKHDGPIDTAVLEPVDPGAHIRRLIISAESDAGQVVQHLSAYDGVKEVAGSFDPQTAAGWTQVNLRLPRYVGLFFNTSHDVLISPKVRQALAMSIPRQAIADAVGDAEVVWAPIPVLEQRGAQPNTEEQIASNAKRAAELLFDAGWRISSASGGVRVKGGKELVINLATRRDPDYAKAVDLIRDAWKDLGVTVTVVSAPSVTDLESGIVRPGNYDALLIGITTGSDLDLYPSFHSSQVGAANFSRYKDLDADLLMEKVRKTPDPVAQRAVATQLIDLLQRDAPAVFLYSPYHPYALRTGVDQVLIPPRLGTIADRFNLFSAWTVNHDRVWNAN